MNENEWTDDRLLHELMWAAEALIDSLQKDGSLLAFRSAKEISRLESWVIGTRNEWYRRSQVELNHG